MRSDHVEIRNFKTFQAVVDCGGFTKAAEQLGYAQSTVTAHIKDLEDYYNMQLFDRIGKSVVLTQFGAELIEHARSLIHEYDITCGVSQLNRKLSGKIKIGVPESVLLYRIFPVIKEYKDKYPDIEVIIVVDVCIKLLERLQNGELDISFCLQPSISHHSLNTTVLCKEKFYMVVPSSYNKPIFKPDDSMLVLFIESGVGYRKIMEDYFESIGYSPKNILEISNVEAIKKLIVEGKGITLLPSYAIHEEANKDLVKVFDCCLYDPYYTQMAVHSNKWINPAMKAFMELTKIHAEKWFL